MNERPAAWPSTAPLSSSTVPCSNELRDRFGQRQLSALGVRDRCRTRRPHDRGIGASGHTGHRRTRLRRRPGAGTCGPPASTTSCRVLQMLNEALPGIREALPGIRSISGSRPSGWSSGVSVRCCVRRVRRGRGAVGPVGCPRAGPRAVRPRSRWQRGGAGRVRVSRRVQSDGGPGRTRPGSSTHHLRASGRFTVVRRPFHG